MLGTHVLVRVVLIIILGVGTQLLGSPIATAQGQSTVNLQIIVDQSGSMAGATNTGVLKIDSAKTVLKEVINQIPEVDGVNVGLRVYGHLGTNQPEGQAVSCQSTELLVPMAGVDKAALSAQVETLQPVGWTPIGLSLEAAAADFTEPASATVNNVIILVTDGLETCGSDPAIIAEELKNSPQAVTTHVIGFGTKPEELQVLEGITNSSGGELISSQNSAQLMSAIFSILEELEVVEATGDGSERYSPIAMGRSGSAGDYEITVLGTQPEVPNAYNFANYGEPAPLGEQFYGITVSVTYVGPGSATPYMDLVMNTVGAGGKSYDFTTAGCSSNETSQRGFFLGTELFTGGTAEYELCFQVSNEDAQTLQLYVEPNIWDTDDRLWFSLGNPTPPSPDAVDSTEDATSEREQTASTPSAAVNDRNYSVTDEGFDPNRGTIQSGENTIVFSNEGTSSCSLRMDGIFPLDLGALPPGQSVDVETEFEPGRLMFYCSEPDDTGGGDTLIIIVE